MSDVDTEKQGDEPAATAGAATLSRALRRAQLALFWEQLWPALAALTTAAGLFLALSWFGLWVAIPPLARAIGVFVFFVLAVAAALPLVRVRWPDVVAGLRRLDHKSLLPHRPATAIADRMAPEAGDQFAVALWRAHIEKALRAASSLKADKPSPRVAAHDPYAVRALVLILAVSAFFIAGSDRVRRVAAAFDWHGVVTPANYRIDAWVTPPSYTGRPPLILESGQAAASAVRCAEFRAGVAAGADPRPHRPDHQGPLRASVGRHRRGDDAGCSRRGQQRRSFDPA